MFDIFYNIFLALFLVYIYSILLNGAHVSDTHGKSGHVFSEYPQNIGYAHSVLKIIKIFFTI